MKEMDNECNAIATQNINFTFKSFFSEHEQTEDSCRLFLCCFEHLFKSSKIIQSF